VLGGPARTPLERGAARAQAQPPARSPCRSTPQPLPCLPARTPPAPARPPSRRRRPSQPPRVARESGPGVPPPARQGQELYDRWLLDVPKLLDLAAIYGPSNPGLVARLVAQLLELQPRYFADIAGAAGPLAGNLRELRASCAALAAKALRGGGDAGLMAELTGAAAAAGRLGWALRLGMRGWQQRARQPQP
jgi:hypothetical protein